LAGAPGSHCATPPWLEHVPERVLLCEYVPSVHFAEAPVGSVLLALDVEDELEEVVLVCVGALGGEGGAVGAGEDAAVVVVGVPTPPW